MKKLFVLLIVLMSFIAVAMAWQAEPTTSVNETPLDSQESGYQGALKKLERLCDCPSI